MGLDIFVYYLRIPVFMAGFLLVLAFFVIGKPLQPLPSRFAQMSIRRIVLGIGGATFATLLLAVFETKGDMGGVAYLAVLLLPLVWFVSILVGIPLTILLAKYGKATLLSVLVFTGIVSLFWGGFVYMFPSNSWCIANLGSCIGHEIRCAMLFIGIPSLGFGLMARLPLRSGNT